MIKDKNKKILVGYVSRRWMAYFGKAPKSLDLPQASNIKTEDEPVKVRITIEEI